MDAAAASDRTCCECGRTLAAKDFSKSQLRRAEGSRCKACVEAGSQSPWTTVVVGGRALRLLPRSKDPLVTRVDGFLSAEEAVEVIQLAVGRLERSKIAMGGGTTESGRTSSSCSLGHGVSDDVVARALARAAFLSGLTTAHAEEVQVVHYLRQQSYGEHTDYFSLRAAPHSIPRRRLARGRL